MCFRKIWDLLWTRNGAIAWIVFGFLIMGLYLWGVNAKNTLGLQYLDAIVAGATVIGIGLALWALIDSKEEPPIKSKRTSTKSKK